MRPDRSIQTRYARLLEVRVEPAPEGGGQSRLVGLAAVFDTISQMLTDDEGNPFYEVVTPGAFAESIAADDVRAFVEHDSRILGRSRAGKGTLKLWEDDRGLNFDCALADTTYARDLKISVDREDIDGCSFGFQCDEGGDEIDPTGGPDGMPLRRLNRVTLVEVSLGVIFPAYLTTTVSARSLGRAKAAAPAPILAEVPAEIPPTTPTIRHRLAAAQRALKILDL